MFIDYYISNFWITIIAIHIILSGIAYYLIIKDEEILEEAIKRLNISKEYAKLLIVIVLIFPLVNLYIIEIHIRVYIRNLIIKRTINKVLDRIKKDDPKMTKCVNDLKRQAKKL